MEAEKLLIKPMEAARMLSVGRASIYRLIAEGVIPSVRLGGSLRVSLDGLREWINAHSSESKAA